MKYLELNDHKTLAVNTCSMALNSWLLKQHGNCNNKSYCGGEGDEGSFYRRDFW
jgi:hypothetical protein